MKPITPPLPRHFPSELEISAQECRILSAAKKLSEGRLQQGKVPGEVMEALDSLVLDIERKATADKEQTDILAISLLLGINFRTATFYRDGILSEFYGNWQPRDPLDADMERQRWLEIRSTAYQGPSATGAR